MATKEMVERAQARTAAAKQQAAEAQAKLNAFQGFWQEYLANENAPGTQAADDVAGALLGLASWHGGSALFKWLETPKDASKPNFLTTRHWIGEGAQAALSAALYAGNLTLARGAAGVEPLSPLRQIGRQATLTHFTFALDALLVRGYKAIKASRAAAEAKAKAEAEAAALSGGGAA